MSAVAKDPHFFSSFVGPLSDWSGQTLLFSYWSTQTECSTHACSSQQSCVALCAHLSADGFTTWYKFSLVVAVDNPLHVSLIVTISDKSILVDEIGWKFLHGNLYRYPCLALPWLTCCCWWMLAAWLSRSTCSVSWSSRWWRLASNISRGGWGPGECNDCCSDGMMVGVIQVRGENLSQWVGNYEGEGISCILVD